ncbi:MAG: twin-arginine translocation signal domain-containing protein [Dysgonamonadaceae bacterium]|nr:twin-arginine translocation signal domain-containing protein [Dysgonamonadaceae bacterium]
MNTRRTFLKNAAITGIAAIPINSSLKSLIINDAEPSSLDNCRKYCRIEVVEEGSGLPVPLVELQTVHQQRFITDNAGVIAFDEPELMGREVWFNINGYGYGVKPDSFGYAGVRLKPEAGTTLRVEVQRNCLAQRIGRITGAGLPAESQKIGEYSNVAESGIVGCDSIQIAEYEGKTFMVWGDTSLARYPLGIFHSSAAMTSLNPFPNPAPPIFPAFNYFRDDKGVVRGVAKMPGSGPTWLSGLVSLPSANGKQRLCAVYTKITPPLEAYECGLCVWNDKSQSFELLKVIWTKSDSLPKMPPLPDGHSVIWRTPTGEKQVLFGDPLPRMRCKATFEAWQNPSEWQQIEHQKTIASPKDNTLIEPHSGSIAWNGYLKRWVAIFMQKFGKPAAFGEVWYAEASSPTGVWGNAVKILSHGNYTFYNPRLHAEWTPPDAPYLLFEGTFTATFADKPPIVPRYDYNQILYRLDLKDFQFSSRP